MRIIPQNSPVAILSGATLVPLPPGWALEQPYLWSNTVSNVQVALSGDAIIQNSPRPKGQLLNLESRGYWWVPYSVISSVMALNELPMTLKYHGALYEVVFSDTPVSFERMQKHWPILPTDTITSVTFQFIEVG